uniref:Metalloproteinase inhibitor 2 n=1 Tax=Panagrellus redivivus TaxID=6233 RepID=A0A7E4VVH9_PANRE
MRVEVLFLAALLIGAVHADDDDDKKYGEERHITATIEETENEYEVVKEPLIVRIDRNACRAGTQSCFCYRTSEPVEDVRAAGVCGPGWGFFCSRVPYADFHTSVKGVAVMFRSGTLANVPSFKLMGHIMEKGNVVAKVGLRKTDSCSVITVENLYEHKSGSDDEAPECKDKCPCLARKETKDD